MRIEQSVYRELCKTLTVLPPERGGILGMKDDVICIYYLDDGPAPTDRYAYVPDVPKLNTVLFQWQQQGIQFAGMFHSHPNPQIWLSIADREYIQKIMQAMPSSISRLYFPLIVPNIGIVGYRSERTSGEIVLEDIIQVNDCVESF